MIVVPIPNVFPADVRDRWVGDDLSVTDAQLQRVLDDAVDIVTTEVQDLEAMIASGAVPQDRFTRVIAGMAIRYLRNPSGVRTVQQTTGQFSGSTTYAGDSLGELVFTDADRRALLGKSVRTGRRAFSVMPGGGVL